MPAKSKRSGGEQKLGTAIVVSYVPLLQPDAFFACRVSDCDNSELMDRLREVDRCPDGHVDGCLWLAEGDAVVPVFIMDKALAIADHLLTWSEQKPDEWFALCFVERGDRYAAILFPNLDKSFRRFQVGWLDRFEEVVTPDRCNIIFRHLHFVSNPGHLFGTVRSRIPSRTMLGFVDTADVDRQNPCGTESDRVKMLGPFPVCWDGKPFGFDIGSIVDDLFAPATAPDDAAPRS